MSDTQEQAIDRVINQGSEHDHILACLRLIYQLLKDSTSKESREKLGTLAFLMSHTYYEKYPDLEALGANINEWSKLLGESKEWADQYERDFILNNNYFKS